VTKYDSCYSVMTERMSGSSSMYFTTSCTYDENKMTTMKLRRISFLIISYFTKEVLK